MSADSFSDGGKYLTRDAALSHVAKMIEAGADIIDIGAESTRPEAKKLSASEEMKLLIGQLEAVRAEFSDIPISVDTYKPAVASEAVKSGADIINDVFAETDGDFYPMAAAAAELNCPLVITHNSRGAEITGDFFGAFMKKIGVLTGLAQNGGLSKSQIVIDPGVGFGKTADQNFEIMARLGELRKFGFPVLLGVSRKSSLARIVGEDFPSRDSATITVSALCAYNKWADILRVHDVAGNVAAVKTAKEILKWTK